MKALVGIGSNIDACRNVESACQCLAREATLLALSRSWWTPPVGTPPGSPPFLNCVALVETRRRPGSLRRWLRAIERDHRRIRTQERNAPRTLDLDALAVDGGGGWVFLDDVADQPFHLLPMRDILPDLRLPDGRTVRQAVHDAPIAGVPQNGDRGGMVPPTPTG